MQKKAHRFLAYFGFLAPLWMLGSVTYSGLIYPGYSHSQQAMSELHAVGSPIEHIAPVLNHYPLFLLFSGFGIFVMSYCGSRAARVSGSFILLHGVATLSAGYFPCDAGCVPETPSTSHIVHGLSGLVILVSFLVAPAIWATVARRELQQQWFGWFSAVVVVAQFVVMVPLMGAMETGEGFGYYQRLAYSIPLAWLAVLSFTFVLNDRTLRPIFFGSVR